MSAMDKMLCIGCVLLCYLSVSHCASKLDYYNLHNDIFSLYNPDIRPVTDDTEVLEISLDFYLISVSELQEKDQTLVTFGYIWMYWEDDFLAWDPTSYNDLNDMVVPQSKVWRPDIVVGNSVDKRSKIGFDEMPIRLSADGFITWEPSILLKTSCDIDIQYYPFDTQVCTIVIETMVSQISELNLVLGQPEVFLDEYSPNGQWDLVDTVIEKKDETLKSAIHIKLHLKRRRTFYILNIILPILLLSVMGSLTFALPADAGEKMSLSITVLLAYVVFLTIISDSMPQTSLQISLLAVYLTGLVALSALSVLLSIPILRIHHKDSSIPVPASAVWFVRRIGMCQKNRVTTPTANSVGPEFDKDALTKPNFFDDFRITWQDVSKAVDALLCWIFLSFTLISTFVFVVLMLIN